jgi:hypothetical protein
MWESPAIDQADAYGKDLLSKAKLTEVEKFHLLRGISVTIVGVRVNGNAKSKDATSETNHVVFLSISCVAPNVVQSARYVVCQYVRSVLVSGQRLIP